MARNASDIAVPITPLCAKPTLIVDVGLAIFNTRAGIRLSCVLKELADGRLKTKVTLVTCH